MGHAGHHRGRQATSDINMQLLQVSSEKELLELSALTSFINDLNDGSGVGFFLFGVRISEELVKSVVGFVVTLALAYVTTG